MYRYARKMSALRVCANSMHACAHYICFHVCQQYMTVCIHCMCLRVCQQHLCTCVEWNVFVSFVPALTKVVRHDEHDYLRRRSAHNLHCHILGYHKLFVQPIARAMTCVAKRILRVAIDTDAASKPSIHLTNRLTNVQLILSAVSIFQE